MSMTLTQITLPPQKQSLNSIRTKKQLKSKLAWSSSILMMTNLPCRWAWRSLILLEQLRRGLPILLTLSRNRASSWSALIWARSCLNRTSLSGTSWRLKSFNSTTRHSTSNKLPRRRNLLIKKCRRKRIRVELLPYNARIRSCKEYRLSN